MFTPMPFPPSQPPGQERLSRGMGHSSEIYPVVHKDYMGRHLNNGTVYKNSELRYIPRIMYASYATPNQADINQTNTPTSPPAP